MLYQVPKKQADEVQAYIKGLCGIQPKGGHITYFSVAVKNFNGLTYREYRTSPNLVPNPLFIYAYYFNMHSTTNGHGHVVSMFKSGGIWYFYDNEGILFQFPYELNSYVVTNLLLTQNKYTVILTDHLNRVFYQEIPFTSKGVITDMHFSEDYSYIFSI